MSHIPLIVMTADRPPEHQSWGVGQTFQQTGLFHRQVRAEFAMPVGGDGGLDFCHRSGWRAALTADEQLGSVHVNWPFRLPLEPTAGPQQVEATFQPSARSASPLRIPSEVEQLTALLNASNYPVIVAGPQSLGGAGGLVSSSTPAEQLCSRAAASAVPILADALSGLRGPARDALVRRPALATARSEVDGLDVDLVIHIGQTPTAKALRLWWESQAAVHVLIDPRNEWQDPSHCVDHRFSSNPVELLTAALDGYSLDGDHMSRWMTAGTRADDACAEALAEWTSSHEGVVAADLSDYAGQDDVIVASSSMPVRDIDTFATVECAARMHANRGINGIDGVVSTASGIASSLTTGHCYVLIGDVALHHDVGGVLDAARNGIKLTIVVVNNDGGGIFSHLPARAALDDATYDRLFQTAHGATFEFLGGYPGVSYHASTSVGSAIEKSHASSDASVHIIEIATDSAGRAAQHADLLGRLKA